MSEHAPEIFFANARALAAGARQALKPPPRRTLSDWMDEKYRLSPDAGAAEPGRWKTLPFQRGWADAMSDPRIWQVALMKSARVGWTETLKGLVGYHVDYDPCPILLIQPTEDDAKGFSKESIEPLLRDVPCVGEKFAPYATRNTLLLKRFLAGLVQLASSRKPGDFRRVGRRVIAGDEIDGYPISAGKEGDPIRLAAKRSEYFWNRKLLWGSTPTIAGLSRIEQLFFEGDQRRYYVPCPHCGFMQVLQLGNLQWPKDPVPDPMQAYFVCIACEAPITHDEKRAMVEAGEWRPGPHPQFPNDPPPQPFDGRASFHIWAAYSFSPNAEWGQLAKEFLEAKRGGPEKLKTYVNTVLGETWNEHDDGVEPHVLLLRREAVTPEFEVPAGACCLTAGIDTQDDRLEVVVVAWGPGEESWVVDRHSLPGDTDQPEPWRMLDEVLDTPYRHATGQTLMIQAACIDSAGHRTTYVYDYAFQKAARRVYAIIGRDGQRPIVSSPSPRRWGRHERQVPLYTVGVDAAKSLLVSRLSLTEKGPGYVHLPHHDWCDEEFAAQLTSERLVTKWLQQFWKKIRARNDALDCFLYAIAALRLLNPKLAVMLEILRAHAPQQPPPASGAAATAPAPRRQRRMSRSSYLG